MTVYITKYALTRGVITEEIAEATESSEVVRVTGAVYRLYRKPYWYTDKGEAIAHAEQQRKSSISSLRNEIKNLENLSF